MLKRNKIKMIISFVFLLTAVLNVSVLGAEPFNFFGRNNFVNVKIAIIHYFPALGEVEENTDGLTELIEEALENGANIVVTPELSTTGFSITREQVNDELGFIEPFTELEEIETLADEEDAYVFVGIAEKTNGDDIYNSVAIFGPDGYIGKQQKRGLSGWQERGGLPFDVIQTEYGEIASIICSDSYLPDWVRTLTLKGADIVLLSANWWGTDQDTIWRTRARENGLWMFVANRWGEETDDRWGYPYNYYMNDAPSVAISPSGEFKLFYKSEDDPEPENKIFYQDIQIPQCRIGSTFNPVYSINSRSVDSYSEIRNEYYRPDLDNAAPPDLPNPGVYQVASLAYTPSCRPEENLSEINTIWNNGSDDADIVVLPGLGVTPGCTAFDENWYTQYPWSDLRDFVDLKEIKLLVTTAINNDNNQFGIALVIMQEGLEPIFVDEVHDYFMLSGTYSQPYFIDLPQARIGIMTGIDSLFPEMSTALSKSGVDFLLISSIIGANSDMLHNVPLNSSWNKDSLIALWKTRTNHVFHLAAADKTGVSIIVSSKWGSVDQVMLGDSQNPRAQLELDSAAVRSKYLNAYYPFDFVGLLGE